jgi:hypothetical protein
MTIHGMMTGDVGNQHTSKTNAHSMRTYLSHAEYGGGAVVELALTEYNTFEVRVMLDNGTQHVLVQGAVSGNAMNIKRYGPTYAIDNTADEDAYYEGS